MSDPIIARCVKIRNAYIKCINSEYKKSIPFLTVEEAIKLAIPQLAPLENGINVADVLNVDVRLDHDSTIYNSCLLNFDILKEIFSLMLQVNNLTAHDGYIKTNLLDKYFNCKTTEYLPGTDCRFYLGGKVQYSYPEIETVCANYSNKKLIGEVIKSKLRHNFPYMEENRLQHLTFRYIMMYVPDPETKEQYTTFEIMNRMKDYGASYYCYDEGFKCNIFTTIKEFYKIHVEMLDPQYQQLIAYKSIDTLILRRLTIVRDYFYTLKNIYLAYKRE